LLRRHGRIVQPKNGDALFLAARQPKSETTSDSVSADLVHLHHVGDEEREGYANGEQPPRIQYPAPPGFGAMGYMFGRLSLRR
jgi:hypothetical protein